jgi:hypothetical protein
MGREGARRLQRAVRMIGELILTALFWLVGVPLSIALCVVNAVCFIAIGLSSLVMRLSTRALDFIWKAPQRA